MIAQYIYDLLLGSDYVVVPGLGGFVCQYQSSIVDRKSAVITPPARTLAFNKSLHQNDGLLVQHIVLKEQKSYKEAEQLVKEFVDKCHLQLDQLGSIQLPKIGRLFWDAQKNLQFTPSFELLPLDDSFGLQSIDIQPVKRITQEIEEIVESDSISATPVVPIERAQKRWPYWVAASFASIFLIGSVWMNMGQPTFDNVMKAGVFSGEWVNTSNQQEVIPVSNQQIRSDYFSTIIQNPIENAPLETTTPVATKNPSSETISEAAHSEVFPIVVGAFNGPITANRFKDKLIADGYDVELKHIEKNSFINVVIQYAATDEATALSEIRSTVEKDAWLLK